MSTYRTQTQILNLRSHINKQRGFIGQQLQERAERAW